MFWVGFLALFRGFSQIFLAFTVRHAGTGGPRTHRFSCGLTLTNASSSSVALSLPAEPAVAAAGLASVAMNHRQTSVPMSNRILRYARGR